MKYFICEAKSSETGLSHPSPHGDSVVLRETTETDETVAQEQYIKALKVLE